MATDQDVEARAERLLRGETDTENLPALANEVQRTMADLLSALRSAREQRDGYQRGCNEWNDKFETWRAEVNESAERSLVALREERDQLKADAKCAVCGRALTCSTHPF